MKGIQVTDMSFSPHLLGKKMGDSELGQRLPGLDEAHLCFNETHLGHVLVGFKDPGGNLTNTPLTCQYAQLLRWSQALLPLPAPAGDAHII